MNWPGWFSSVIRLQSGGVTMAAVVVAHAAPALSPMPAGEVFLDNEGPGFAQTGFELFQDAGSQGGTAMENGGTASETA